MHIEQHSLRYSDESVMIKSKSFREMGSLGSELFGLRGCASESSGINTIVVTTRDITSRTKAIDKNGIISSFILCFPKYAADVAIDNAPKMIHRIPDTSELHLRLRPNAEMYIILNTIKHTTILRTNTFGSYGSSNFFAEDISIDKNIMGNIPPIAKVRAKYIMRHSNFIVIISSASIISNNIM